MTEDKKPKASPKKEESTLYQKLFTVQQAAPAINKRAENPHFRSKYADLATIWEVIKPIMKEQGLYVGHKLSSNEYGEYITTEIVDVATGEKIESSTRMTLERAGAQQLGSYITYMRRYAITAMLGLVTDEDDDASDAATANVKAPPSKPEKKEPLLDGKKFLEAQEMVKEVNSIDELAHVWKELNDTLVPLMSGAQRDVVTSIKNRKKEALS